MKFFRNALLVLAAAAVLSAQNARPAHAICMPCLDFACPLQAHTTQLWPEILKEHAKTLAYFAQKILEHEAWLTAFFYTMVGPIMNSMAQQMTAVIAHQTMTIGMFLDANQQLETQRLLQRLQAQAHKDYHPSQGMCTFGTNVRSLAAADARAIAAKAVLDERFIKRQLGSAGMAAAKGPEADRVARLDNFRSRFCDRYDNNRIDGKPMTGLEQVCAAAVPVNSLNKDVDFYRTVMGSRTIQFDAVNPAPDAEDEDVYALSDNLYAHGLMKNIAAGLLANPENYDEFMELRSLAAKRSVAENAFSSIVGLKAQGGAGAAETRRYMGALLTELGMTAREADAFLGERPSYLAQLEVLAKKIYQRQNFYIDLYDKPANVKRKKAAMQAIGMMVDRDMYNSQIRSEAIMSMLLEMRLQKAQDAVENAIGNLR